MAVRTLNLLDLSVFDLCILAFAHAIPVHENGIWELGIPVLELDESVLHQGQVSSNTKAGQCTNLHHWPDTVNGFLPRRLHANFRVVSCCTLVHRCHQASNRRPTYGTWRRMGNIATYRAVVSDGLERSAVDSTYQLPCRS